jgi:AcrR family transcriptional regulator
MTAFGTATAPDATGPQASAPETADPATAGPATTGPATTGPATTGPATTGPGHDTSAPDPAGVPASLRERKKLATRRALRRVAIDLVAERGFGRVTVEDIAEAADVSPRTFFNYFPTKEAAVFGADPDRLDRLRAGLAAAAPGKDVHAALREVLAADARARAQQLAELGGDAAEWLRRMKSASDDPDLRAAQAAHMARTERVIAEGLAQRLGTDPDRDPYPILLAAAATAVLRAALTLWASSGGELALDHIAEMACDALAAGLPENCALRSESALRRGGKDTPR